MKTEYLVETYDKINEDIFLIIVSTQIANKIKKTFFIGAFHKSEEEEVMKEIFNIYIFKETSHIEILKREKRTASAILSYRYTLADRIRNSYSYKKAKQQIFVK